MAVLLGAILLVEPLQTCHKGILQWESVVIVGSHDSGIWKHPCTLFYVTACWRNAHSHKGSSTTLHLSHTDRSTTNISYITLKCTLPLLA